MLDSLEYRELGRIAETANSYLYGIGIPNFEIIGVNWDDDQHQWVVSYYTDYSNHEYINVWVARTQNGYVEKSHSFEQIQISFDVRIQV